MLLTNKSEVTNQQTHTHHQKQHLTRRLNQLAQSSIRSFARSYNLSIQPITNENARKAVNSHRDATRLYGLYMASVGRLVAASPVSANLSAPADPRTQLPQHLSVSFRNSRPNRD